MISFFRFSFAACALAAQVLKRAPDGVPGYVVQYAPMVYIHSEDPYKPSDIATQLVNTKPEVDFKVVSDQPLSLDDLSSLNNLGGKDVYLTSNVKATQNPEYFLGVLPDSDGQTVGAVSCAIIVNDHGDGTVDAFYFYFYAFDHGALNLGNHVGDWEHSMIRFSNGTPSALWYSQHSNGQAFEYGTVDKFDGGERPIVYSANGSHANYATKGTHAYGIPNVNLPEGPLEDHTDQGPLWDPTLSAYWYNYNDASKAFTAYNAESVSYYNTLTYLPDVPSRDPTDWLSFIGHWGDQRYPDDEPGQDCFLGIDALCRYTDGPTGPADKQLQREKVCPDNGNLCIVRKILVGRAPEDEEGIVMEVRV